jgi:hypothetical protein
MTHDELVDYYVETLGCSIKEAEQLIIDDKRVDKKGEKIEWDYTEEEKKNLRKLTSTGTRKVTKTVKKEKKTDEEKMKIMEMIFKVISENYKNAELTNPERFIDFVTENETSFTITLTRHNKK